MSGYRITVSSGKKIYFLLITFPFRKDMLNTVSDFLEGLSQSSFLFD